MMDILNKKQSDDSFEQDSIQDSARKTDEDEFLGQEQRQKQA